MIEKQLETARGSIHYWVSRQAGAPALCFLHGLGEDHELFHAQYEYFARAYTLIAWDAPGHGASRPYQNSDLLHWATVLRDVLRAEGVDRCVLIGHGLGGLTAQIFIDHWPELARGYVGIGAGPMERSYYSKADLDRLNRAGRTAKLFPFRSLHALIARTRSSSAYGRELMARMLDQYSREELCALIRRGCRNLLRAMEDARIVHCPMLLLLGERDRDVRLRARCREWRDREGVPLYRIRGAGSIANADNPRSVNRLIWAFLEHLR